MNTLTNLPAEFQPCKGTTEAESDALSRILGLSASIEADVVIEEQVFLRANAAVGAGTLIGKETTIGVDFEFKVMVTPREMG